MDESNPKIKFSSNGQCDSCRNALERMPHEWWPGATGDVRTQDLVSTLKQSGRGLPYDAMVGLSGGIDSAYLAHLARRKYGLRILAVHIDGGWNTEPAVRNIESIVRGLGLDLYTYVVEWQEMRDLQLAFLRASVLNQDIPQDHAFFAKLYQTASIFGIRNFLSGVNFASECVELPGFGYPAMDGFHARAIHRRFGTMKLKTYPFMSMPEFIWKTRVRKVLTVHRPLNYINYNKEAARKILVREYDWCDYGGKHSESRFTKFYQEIFLPRKFNFDKRRLHLSSLIVSGQMTRDRALAELEQPISTPEQIIREIRYIAKKLEISRDELERLIENPAVDHRAYPNGMRLHGSLTAAKLLLRRIWLNKP